MSGAHYVASLTTEAFEGERRSLTRLSLVRGADGQADGSGGAWGAAMKLTYLLVHGSWQGAWCWDGVRTYLEAPRETIQSGCA